MRGERWTETRAVCNQGFNQECPFFPSCPARMLWNVCSSRGRNWGNTWQVFGKRNARQGSWRLVPNPVPGTVRPAERVCTEAPAVQLPLQGFQFSWKRKSSAVFPAWRGSTLPGCAGQEWVWAPIRAEQSDSTVKTKGKLTPRCET